VDAAASLASPEGPLSTALSGVEESVAAMVESSPLSDGPASPASDSPASGLLPEPEPELVPAELSPLVDPDVEKKTVPDAPSVPLEVPLSLPLLPVDAEPLLLEPQPTKADQANAVKARRALARATEYPRIRSLR
jgi:hypothetical protein